MWDGKKATATRVLLRAMDRIKEEMPDADPIQVFAGAVENVKPTRRSPIPPRRRGQLPGADAGEAEAAAIAGDPLAHRRHRGKAGRPMFERLAEELMAAYRREGEAMSKRETTIKMADANKAFSHFAW